MADAVLKRKASANRRATAPRGATSIADMIDHAPFAVALVDERAVCRYINAAFRKQFGNIIGDPLKRLFPDTGPLGFSHTWTICRVVGGFSGTLLTTAKRDRHGICDVTVYRLTPSNPARYAVMLRDASDRVRAEQERQDWQTRFELAVSIARDGIVDWDLESGAATFSSRFLAILNAEKRRQNFTIAAWQQRILKPDRQRVRAAITDHLANPRVPLLIEHRINRGRGDARTVILRGMAVVDAAGRPYRLIGSLTDVTEQREAESRARQHLAELAQLARFFSVGQFVATLAHEISQPITSISAFAAGVRRQIDPAQASPLLLESLQAIQTQAERAAEIVRRVRQFVRPEGTQRQEVCLNVVAREVLALLAPELSNARVKLNVRLSKAKLIVQADPLQIEQVLVNLIRNAAEALSPLTPSRRSMGIESRSASGAAQIIIWDEGPGIDAKVQRKLFKPFVSSKEGGLGVGLALSKTLIESHGGKLSLERSPKHRTQAKILLPLLGSRSRSKSRD